MLLKCDCKSEYQDKAYGKGMRVHNLMAKSPTTEQMARCTVCCKEHVVTEKKD